MLVFFGNTLLQLSKDELSFLNKLLFFLIVLHLSSRFSSNSIECLEFVLKKVELSQIHRVIDILGSLVSHPCFSFHLDCVHWSESIFDHNIKSRKSLNSLFRMRHQFAKDRLKTILDRVRFKVFDPIS